MSTESGVNYTSAIYQKTHQHCNKNHKTFFFASYQPWLDTFILFSVHFSCHVVYRKHTESRRNAVDRDTFSLFAPSIPRGIAVITSRPPLHPAPGQWQLVDFREERIKQQSAPLAVLRYYSVENTAQCELHSREKGSVTSCKKKTQSPIPNLLFYFRESGNRNKTAVFRVMRYNP